MYDRVTVRVYSIAETLGIIYRCGPLRKRVSLNIQFCQEKRLFWAIFTRKSTLFLNVDYL